MSHCLCCSYRLLLPAMAISPISWPDLGHCGKTSVVDDWVRRPAPQRDSLHYVHMTSPHLTLDTVHHRLKPEQKTDDSAVVNPAHTMVNVGQFLFGSTDMQLLQLMAVILDVLLIWHRLTRLFVTARMLCASVDETVLVHPPGEQVQFKCIVTDGEMQENLLPLCGNNGGTTSEETAAAGESDTQPSQSESVKPKHNGHLYHACADDNKLADSERTGRITIHSKSLRISKLIVTNFVHSNLVPTFVITSVFLLSVYCVTIVMTDVMTVTWCRDFGGLLPHMNGLDAHHASTWWFMQYMARHHTTLLSVWYRRTVQIVMAEIKGFTDYFNSGLSTFNYIWMYNLDIISM